MRYISTLSIFILFSLKSISKDILVVDHWLLLTYGSLKGEKKVFQRIYFDDSGNMLKKITFSKVGFNIIDSVVYDQKDKKYSHYTAKPKLSQDSVIGFEYVFSGNEEKQSFNENYFQKKMSIKDSLGLLQEDLSELSFVIENSKKVMTEESTRQKYIARFKPMILADYVSTDSYLDSCIIYVTDHKIVKSEFYYKKTLIERIYKYEEFGLIKEIITNVKSKHQVSVYTEGFTMNSIVN